MNMPKHTRSSSSSHNRYSNPNAMPVSLAPSAPVPIYSTRPSLPLNTGGYYPTIASTSAQPPMQQQYDAYPADVVTQAPMPNRPSSGAWTVQDDQNLLAARQQGLNWAQIQSSYFPNKSPNACRKRHERLMERKGADDWDNRKLERLAKEYMSMRKEIWQPLAARTGEKWLVVEAKCMNNGLKNLQSAARSAARRERLESGHPMHGYDDDSGISGIGLTPVDDLDASYSSPETTASSSHSGGSNGGGYGGAMHPMALSSNPYGANYTTSAGGLSSSYGSSVSSTAAAAHYSNAMHGSHSQGGSPYMGDGQRLPSVDMGIDAIINRPGHNGGHAHGM
ncbi:putative myb family transcription factor protein [Daldinia childiae]|uniref:putative myb family transcription factor protein n=1 Tax=Daldinia childiae TaxID=326645 RepID=UPI0014470390|nr:putative myb family transcription factor protein [Daldinia childiae]KAF3065793.1 putative myb family transcription factor protein [Daldinia childiae]